jgi:hypothetical protein
MSDFCFRRFEILKIYYDLVIDVMLWGWKMPATLWYYSARVLGKIYGVDPNKQA